jgi:hypothetical protein
MASIIHTEGLIMIFRKNSDKPGVIGIKKYTGLLSQIIGIVLFQK